MSSADEKHRKREREKARALRKSRWWQQKLEECLCHYCGASFEKGLLTMDHIVPVARGGKSVKGNVVVCCKSCNTDKAATTPEELILEQLARGD